MTNYIDGGSMSYEVEALENARRQAMSMSFINKIKCSMIN
jgi:hypothetical protein